MLADPLDSSADMLLYTRVIDGRQTAGKPILPLQHIITIGMDLAACLEGYD